MILELNSAHVEVLPENISIKAQSYVPGRRKANPKSLEMVVTYGPLVVNNHARFGYLATPIVFGDFPAVVGSPYFLGVVPARHEEDAAQKSPSNKSTKKTSRSHANTRARPAAINKGTQMLSKNNVVKGAKPQIRTFSVQTISSQIIALVPSQRGQNKNHKSKRPPAATSRSGKSIMIGGLRVRIDGSQPVIPRDSSAVVSRKTRNFQGESRCQTKHPALPQIQTNLGPQRGDPKTQKDASKPAKDVQQEKQY
ncbi:hypothetical protein Taro_030442 [Colocasia esculenta]|uniref:Uncharacterized protein n=1 Tax=Colocasia esculenta TaxID=4460 RepID=A0A843VMG5_COLES|nr:hypothetical protein [Colocasia esculenta]